MPLKTMQVPIDFTGGLDTKTDPKTVLKTKLLVLENAIFKTPGSVRKRLGYSLITNTIFTPADKTNTLTSLNQVEALHRYGPDTLALATGKRIFGYSSSGGASWVDAGAFTSVNLSARDIAGTKSGPAYCDCAYWNGFFCYAWTAHTTTDVLYAKVITEPSEAEHASAYLLDSGLSLSSDVIQPRVVTVGNRFFVFWQKGANIKVAAFDPGQGTPSFTAATTLVSDASTASFAFDVDVTTNTIILAYGRAADVRIVQINATTLAVLGSPAPTAFSYTADNALQVYRHPTSGNIYVLWSNATDTLIGAVTGSHAAYIPATVLDASISTAVAIGRDPAQTNRLRAWWSNDAGWAGLKTASLDQTTGAITGATRALVGTYVASRAFEYNSVQYVLARTADIATGPPQASYLVLTAEELSSTTFPNYRPKAVARLGYGRAFFSRPISVVQPSTGRCAFVVQRATTILSNYGTSRTAGVTRYDLDFASIQDRNHSVVFGDALFLPSANASLFDKTQVVEAGFHYWPELAAAITQSAGGSLTALGTYRYTAVYEWIDENGQVHQSAPSASPDTYTSVTLTAGNQTVTVTVGNLWITDKENLGRKVSIVLYRTLANQSGPFYRVTGALGAVDNNAGAVTTTIQDSVADSILEQNPILYTTGGVLDNMPPPPCLYARVFDNRLWAINAEDGSLWYSKSQVATEGPAFNEGFQFPAIGSPIERPTGLEVMDDKLVVFKPNEIFVIFGQGPNDLGQGSTYSQPQSIPTDVGCNNAKSIIAYPGGILFQSKKGIYRLDRSLQVQYIGAPVERFNLYSLTGQDMLITSAVLLEKVHQIRFTLYNTGGYALVYDYLVDQWSTFTNHDAIGAALWQGTYFFAKSNGTVYKEDVAADYRDANATYSMKLQTAWIALNGLGGFQRVKRLIVEGTFRSPCSINVRPFYDFNDQWGALPSVIPVSLTGYSGNAFDIRVHLPKQKCRSIAFQLYDTGGNESFDLTQLILEVGVKRGQAKLHKDLSK